MSPSGATGRRSQFQFTPLREGRLGLSWQPFQIDISIHAPPRGATSAGRCSFAPPSDFNSRPSARGDVLAMPVSGVPNVYISIHAPPRGATESRFFHAAFAALFQFTPLREGRPMPSTPPAAPTIFQFTPLREGRRFSRCAVQAHLRFQFTPLREGRLQHRQSSGAMSIFQFTPLREGRQEGWRNLRNRRPYFNSRPSARGDEEPMNYKKQDIISIHAPPRGATDIPAPSPQAWLFQFTPLREGRRLQGGAGPHD